MTKRNITSPFRFKSLLDLQKHRAKCNRLQSEIYSGNIMEETLFVFSKGNEEGAFKSKISHTRATIYQKITPAAKASKADVFKINTREITRTET
ncbi:uncharacterized protein LOC106877463 isoform X3 [Octopus bimaculoides]|uniref:uncharacterized protein LOC106877463 isoform X3 n=1 Tax=Octopus bimaculoides TaxID=37653 RepID=UPI00071E6830|nr:uncharacterized protein LOC106877463 isoform X3 [Octopus bimaculoides]|eukprot:XP_014781855.1 PREDICTED: uncharacterized protein LOC106877463 isoform X3 [Octopus bimaculoides]